MSCRAGSALWSKCIFPFCSPGGVQRGIKENCSWAALWCCAGWRSLFPEPCSSWLLSVWQNLPALCSARCCKMMLMVIKLYGPFFKGSCSSDLLAGTAVSVQDAAKQSAPRELTGGLRWMHLPAVSGVRWNDAVGVGFPGKSLSLEMDLAPEK